MQKSRICKNVEFDFQKVKFDLKNCKFGSEKREIWNMLIFTFMDFLGIVHNSFGWCSGRSMTKNYWH